MVCDRAETGWRSQFIKGLFASTSIPNHSEKGTANACVFLEKYFLGTTKIASGPDNPETTVTSSLMASCLPLFHNLHGACFVPMGKSFSGMDEDGVHSAFSSSSKKSWNEIQTTKNNFKQLKVVPIMYEGTFWGTLNYLCLHVSGLTWVYIICKNSLSCSLKMHILFSICVIAQ